MISRIRLAYPREIRSNGGTGVRAGAPRRMRSFGPARLPGRSVESMARTLSWTAYRGRSSARQENTVGPVPATQAVSDVRPVSMPLVDRIASGVVTAVPPIILAIGMWLGWSSGLLVWQDILVLAISYAVIGTGITVGFHRLLTHRSFKCHRLLRAGFAALGSAAAEGPVIDWVATHRKHHQF